MGTLDMNVDAPPAEEEEEVEMEKQPFMFYITDVNVTYKIVETKYGQFCLIAGILYLYHLIWTMAGVNMFSS